MEKKEKKRQKQTPALSKNLGIKRKVDGKSNSMRGKWKLDNVPFGINLPILYTKIFSVLLISMKIKS